MKNMWLKILTFCLGLTGIVALELTDLRVPGHAIRYHDVVLGCDYDLEGEILYSVKWYKDGHEFYRYVPNDSPTTMTFVLPGVTVDMHNSTQNAVVLQSVQLTSSGTYRCEVSGEAPSFQTVMESAHMTVVALPEEGPKISGGKPRYRIGDTVNLTCTSGRSKPAAQLTWKINGEPADPKFLRGPRTFTSGREGLETTILGLEFVAKHKHFKKGNLKLKCVATIATIYLVSNEESVEGERPAKGIVLESRGTVAPSSSRADQVYSGGTQHLSSTAATLLFFWLCLSHYP